MRTTGDRIRHAVSFEILGLALATPLGAWIFALPLADVGLVGVVSAALAMLWTYAFNLGFDRVLHRRLGHARKTVPLRIGHAVLYEIGLVMVLIPFIAWYLAIGWWQALMMDLAFSVFFMVYAFAFNWLYDVVFPVPLDRSAG